MGVGKRQLEQLYVPGGATQASWLQVLFKAMVVLDLSWDRNGHRSVANEFNRLAAWMRVEGNTQECAVRRDATDDCINQLKPTGPESKPARAFLT